MRKDTLVNPQNIPKLALRRLKHCRRTDVRGHALLIQYNGEITLLLSLHIISWARVFIRSHERVIVYAVVSAPDDVSRGQDAGIKVRLHEDGAVLGVPGTAESAATDDGFGNGAVGRFDFGVGDVDAVLVLESCVCA